MQECCFSRYVYFMILVVFATLIPPQKALLKQKKMRLSHPTDASSSTSAARTTAPAVLENIIDSSNKAAGPAVTDVALSADARGSTMQQGKHDALDV
jgi:hypothetical protein